MALELVVKGGDDGVTFAQFGFERSRLIVFGCQRNPQRRDEAISSLLLHWGHRDAAGTLLAEWVDVEVEWVRILHVDRELKPVTRIEEQMASIDFNLKHSIWHQFITGRVGVMGYTAIGLMYLYVHPKSVA